MKLEVTKDRLRQALTVAEKMTGKNLSLAALGYVYLAARDHALVVRATNLDVGLDLSLPAKVEAPGEVLVSGAVVGNYVSSLPAADSIKLEKAGNNLVITSGANSSVFRTYPADDFPALPKPTKPATFSLQSEELVAGLRRTGYAASWSDIKPEIASVYLYQDGKELVFAATDSFRLSEYRTPVPDLPEAKEPLRAIIPIKNTSDLLRVWEGTSAGLTVHLDRHQIVVVSEGVTFTSRLVEGIFPDYRQIIPTATLTQVIALKADVVSALKLAQIFSDKLNQVSLTITPGEKLFEIRATSGEIGEYTTRLEATLEGEALELTLNVKYVLDALGSIAGDSVNLRFNGKQKPLVLAGVGASDFRALVMPLNR